MIRSKRILIADDDESLVDCLARRCRLLDLKVEKAYDGITALHKIDAFDPDLLILDINMPEGNGLRVCEMIARDPELKSIPTIILTGRKDAETIQNCGAVSAHYVPKGPNAWSRLKPLVTSLLDLDRESLAITNEVHKFEVHREDVQHLHSPDSAAEPPVEFVAQETDEESSCDCPEAASDHIQSEYIDAVFTALGWDESPGDNAASDNPAGDKRTEWFMTRPWVLCIDDDPGFAELLKVRLKQQGVEVVQAHAGMAGYRYAFTSEAQAIILDYELPDGNGDYVLRRLKENPVTKDIPVIVLTGRKERILERKMYNLGAVRFFTKPVPWDDLWKELRRHLHQNAQPAMLPAGNIA
jgi:DNA-binding response OmpR family regulator